MKEKADFKIILLKIVFICFFALFLFGILFLQLVVTAGHSMEPTYFAGDRLLAIHDFQTPEAGDTVLIFHQGNYMVKRVHATAGETVYIDSENFQPYWGSTNVPQGYVFVVGDNLDNSFDSRDEDFGLVPTKEIEGYILFKLWSGTEGDG